MFRSFLRFAAGVAVSASLVAMASDANAGWWHRGSHGSSGSYGSSGSSGSSGSYGSSGSSGSYGSSGSWGGHRSYASSGSYGSSGSSGSHGSSGGGLFSRIHARWHSRHSSGSYGSSGSSGSYGGSSGGYGYSAYSSGSSGSYGGSSYGGSSGGSYGGSYGSGVVVDSYAPSYSETPSYGTPFDSGDSVDNGAVQESNKPMAPMAPEPVDPPANETPAPSLDPSQGLPPSTVPPAVAPPSTQGDEFSPAPLRDSTRATLRVRMPVAAKLFVNEQPTSSTGDQRVFVSENLVPGKVYAYNLRAEMVIDGKKVNDTQRVLLTAGQGRNVAFDLERIARNRDGETVVTVKAPADAKVTLSGNSTDATGEVRVFATKSLKPGQSWENYVVEASIVRDGRTFTKSQTLTVNSGDKQTVAFDFDSLSVADAR